MLVPLPRLQIVMFRRNNSCARPVIIGEVPFEETLGNNVKEGMRHPDGRSRTLWQVSKVGGISSGRERRPGTGETMFMAQWENSSAVYFIS